MLQSLGIPQTSIQELLISAGDNNRVRQQLDQTLTFYPIVLDEVVETELFQVFIQTNLLPGNNAIAQGVNQVAPRIILLENQLTGEVPGDLTLTFDEYTNDDGVLDTVQSATQTVDILGNDNQVIQAAEQSILDLSFFDLRVPNPLAGAATGDINQFLANIASSEILDGLQFTFQEIIIEGNGNFVEQRIEQAIAAFVVLDEAALAELNNTQASPIQFSIQESFGEAAGASADNNFIEQEINQTLIFDPRFVLNFDGVIDSSNGTRLEDFTFAIDDFLERITNELEVLATQNIVQENLITGNENQDNASSVQQTILIETSELIFGDRESNVIEAGVTVTATGLVDGIDDLIFVGGGSDLVDLTAAPLDFFSELGFEVVTNSRIYGGSGEDEIIANSSDRLFGGGGNDLLEAGAGLGDNRLYGGAGNDELIAGAAGGDRLFGNNGDDILDSSLSIGENRLYGGNGDDLLIAGLGDRLIGGSGNDRLFAILGGDNTLTGGRGNDQFWLGGIELGEELNLVTDFISGEDSLGLGDLTLDFDEIGLRQAGADTIIGIGDRDIARLININASSLSAGDFILNSSPVLA